MITDKFIHIHIPKTGGQFIRGLVNEAKHNWKLYIENSHISMTEAYNMIKESGHPLNDIKSFAFTRNPYDYYVSRFFHRRRTINEGI